MSKLRDTVSSIGIVRERRPGVDTLDDNICFFRHALALNEKRVKFLPEYGRGGDTFNSEADGDQDQHITKRYKEVWFFGSHSDVYVIFLSFFFPVGFDALVPTFQRRKKSDRRKLWDVLDSCFVDGK